MVKVLRIIITAKLHQYVSAKPVSGDLHLLPLLCCRFISRVAPLAPFYTLAILHGVPYSTGNYTGLHETTPFLPCTELPFIALQCTALHYTAEQCTALHCTALHCTVMHCTSLHPAKATVLHFTAMQRTTMQLIVAFFTPHFTQATANLAQKFA